jgi:hypothetical protein
MKTHFTHDDRSCSIPWGVYPWLVDRNEFSGVWRITSSTTSIHITIDVVSKKRKRVKSFCWELLLLWWTDKMVEELHTLYITTTSTPFLLPTSCHRSPLSVCPVCVITLSHLGRLLCHHKSVIWYWFLSSMCFPVSWQSTVFFLERIMMFSSWKKDSLYPVSRCRETMELSPQWVITTSGYVWLTWVWPTVGTRTDTHTIS